MYAYSDWITAVCDLLDLTAVITDPTKAAPTSEPGFNAIWPRAVEYAELRLYRDLDFLAARVSDTSGRLASNQRTFSLPSYFIVLEQVQVTDGNGNRQPPLLPVSKDYLEAMWPSDTPATTPSLPTMFAMLDDQTIFVGPPPDSGYKVSVYGVQRATPLSPSNRTTFLTTYLPDLFLAASMVFFTGHQRDWGQQSDDPKMALSWEQTYAALLKGAGVEEARKKFQSVGWSSRFPPSIATPPPT